MGTLDKQKSIGFDFRKLVSLKLSQLPWWFFIIVIIIFGVGSTVYRSYASVERLLVRIDEEKITSIKNFVEDGDLILGTEIDTTSFDTASKYIDSQSIQTYYTYQNAVQALLRGDVDAVIIDLSRGNKFLREFPNTLELVGASLSLNDTENYWESFNFIYFGLVITIRVSLFSYIIAIVFGLLAGLGRISKNTIIKNLATLYVELIRGIPIIVLIFYIALVGVPAIVANINQMGEWLIAEEFSFVGNVLLNVSIRDIPSEWRAIIALSVTYGAFLAEIFRAGIQSIGRGQMEAARSLGMSLRQAMRYVILPQAIRNVLPALANDFIAMVKDSSLVSVLAVQDITHLSRKYTGSSFRYKEAFTILTILYLTITLALSLLVRTMERRLSQDD